MGVSCSEVLVTKKSRKEEERHSRKRKAMTTEQTKGFALFLVGFDFFPFRLLEVWSRDSKARVTLVMWYETFDVRLLRMQVRCQRRRMVRLRMKWLCRWGCRCRDPCVLMTGRRAR